MTIGCTRKAMITIKLENETARYLLLHVLPSGLQKMQLSEGTTTIIEGIGDSEKPSIRIMGFDDSEKGFIKDFLEEELICLPYKVKIS